MKTMAAILEQYRVLLDLDSDVTFSKIDHDVAMVADVYNIEKPGGPCQF